jgi:uncharacterized membrane protein
MAAMPAAQIAEISRQDIAVRRVAFDAPWGWLGAGWRDFWSAPGISLSYGAAFAAVAYIFVLQLSRINALPLLLPLAGGFLLMAPALAVGFYEVSRRRERNQTTTPGGIVRAAREASAPLAYFGVALLLLYFFWMQVVSLLFMLFFGNAVFPPVEQFVPTLLFTAHGLGLLVTGAAAGAVFAATAFSISAIAVPMLLDRKVDVVTAMRASVEAVRLNPPAMMLWAVLIAGLTAAGLVTLFAGLAIAFPLAGYATWHAYRELTGAECAATPPCRGRPTEAPQSRPW